LIFLVNFLADAWLFFLLAANVAMRIVPELAIVIIPLVLFVYAVVYWRVTIVLSIAAITAILLFTPIGGAFTDGFSRGWHRGASERAHTAADHAR
jgi:hypothetical protein